MSTVESTRVLVVVDIEGKKKKKGQAYNIIPVLSRYERERENSVCVYNKDLSLYENSLAGWDATYYSLLYNCTRSLQ